MPFRCALVAFIGSLLTLPALAQGYNFNFGGGPGFPLGKTSDFTNISYNFVAGAGPNLRPHVAMNTEFMFHGLPVQRKIIDQLGVSDVKGRFYSLTGNLIVGSSGRGKSAYLIAGGGWYRRTLEAKQTVLKAGEVCEPEWIWWDVQCVNGIVPTDITVGSRTSSAGGFNVGGGLAFRLGDSSANFYTEVRYHRAFTQNVDTAVLPLTFGIRW
ncbi:MAG: outer membrane beta-barrel protein [Candidatus Sulfotelmatobacter sp.]